MRYIALATAVMLFGYAAQIAQAVTIPTFPSCTATQGSIIAYYAHGTHGVPGDTTTYTGSDTVYKVDDVRVLQCLCPENGEGVQTLWWQYGALSEDDLATLLMKGWVWIPNGTAWGLNDAPYLAKNSSFSCVGRGGAVAGASAESADGRGGTGAGVRNVGQVLGAQLAATGTMKWGVTALATGLFLWILGKDKSNRTA